MHTPTSADRSTPQRTPPGLEAARHRSQRWWRRPWILPLAIAIVGFLAFSLPPYLTLDPARSRVPSPPGFSSHYPLLVAHILFGTIAMVTGCAQIWPWLRRRAPDVHRAMGRVYVFGGVLPGGLLGLTIGAFSPFGPTLRASNVLLACLWLGTTLAGLRAARLRRLGAHRRWMIRSVALTMSIITNRIWAIVLSILLVPQLATTFGGSELALIQTIAGLTGWLGWVTTLLAAEWWLERDATTHLPPTPGIPAMPARPTRPAPAAPV